MTLKTRVIVCGSSVYMASLASGLQAASAFEVVRIPARPPDAPDFLCELEADVIAFDLAEIRVDLPVTLLRERPNLLMLGMDPTSDELLVLSGHHTHALSVADLVAIIMRRESAIASMRNPSDTKDA